MEGIPFDEALNDAQKFTLSPMKKAENKGYFATVRVDRSTVPDGWYAYDIRHTGTGAFSTIEKNIAYVNHAGTFLTKHEIDFNGKDRKALTCGYNFGWEPA